MLRDHESHRNDSSSIEIIADRYRVEHRLAEGGMGIVVCVLDELLSKRVALKKLHPQHKKKRRARMMFELEYRTLAMLSHPSIIRVFDYGLDGGTPYYTMELLEGKDLRDLAPVPYRDACRYLRDVASSLALLHTRRFLHRDLSARNVRLTLDGHCKLLDFGTMCQFGMPPNIAGTPPMVPPEVLQGQSLDHRTDLYSLGALGYYLLTGRHAFRATDFESLFRAWTLPPKPPSYYVKDIPRELDTLLLSMLSLSPHNRPLSAADVIDRLTAIASLEENESSEVMASYLLTSPLIGREKEIIDLKRRVQRLEEEGNQRGSVLLIEGHVGQGKTRILDELALLAQISGAVALRVDGKSHRGAIGVMVALARSIKSALPWGTKEVFEPYKEILSALLASNETNVSLEAQMQKPGGEYRILLQQAFIGWILDIARIQPLAIMIDNLHYADEVSMAFVASLARKARDNPLLLCATFRSGESVLARRAFELTLAIAKRYVLQPLDAPSTHDLVLSLFGSVPNVSIASDFLFKKSGGNPGLCVELARQLVDRKVIVYSDGIWVIPADINEESVPESFAEAFKRRMSKLSSKARLLAEGMAIGRGSVPLEYSVALSDLNEEDILPALDQLIQEGLVVVHGDGYSFVQEGMRTTILDAAKDERRQLLHKRYANMLLESDGLNPERELEAGFHLIDGGETMRGADILARLGPELSKESVTMGEAIPAMETALEKFEQAGRSQADCLTLRAALVFASYFFDYRLAERYGWETIEQLEELAGLNTMERLRPRFGTLLSTAAGLASVGVRNHLGKKRHTALPFFEVITYFVRCISSMIGTCIASLDNEGCKKLVSRLEKLNWLIGPNGYQPVYLMAHAVLLESLGDEAKFVEMANRALKLAEKPFLLGLTDGDRRDLIAGLQHAIGLSECYKIRSTALALADELEKNGGPLATAALLRVRMTYHMLQGDRELTERYRAELETYSIQGGVIWQVEWYGIPIEGAAAVRIADLITLKRVLRDLDRLVQTKPSFSPYRDSTMIGYHMRRGDLEQARKQGERFIAEHPPNSMLGWADAYAAMAMTCNKQRDFDRAYEVCMKAKSAISDADLQYIGIYGFIDIQLALAETGRGNLQRAEELFESSMRVRRSENNPLLMFELAEARVEAAEILGDDEGRANFLAEMYKWSRAAGNPAMLAQCERIAKSAELKPVSSPPEPAPGTQPLPVSDITAIRINTEFNELNDLNDMFAHCEGAKDRALQALRIITQRTASDEGYLYLRKGDNLDLVASLSRGEPPEALEQRVQQLLADSMNTKVSYVEIDSEALPNSLKVQTTKYRIRRMIARNGTNDITLGFVAFSVDSDMDTDIGPSYLRTITEYLRKQGDCVSP